jgi:hypothetical protein
VPKIARKFKLLNENRRNNLRDERIRKKIDNSLPKKSAKQIKVVPKKIH